MEAVINSNSQTLCYSFKKATEAFFMGNSPDSAAVLFWKLFQCWTLKDCTIKAEVTDEEIARFFDQLTDLVAAVYLIHQANREGLNEHGGMQNE